MKNKARVIGSMLLFTAVIGCQTQTNQQPTRAVVSQPAENVAPLGAAAYVNSGNAKQDKGDVNGAIADFTRAIELNPGFAVAYYDRGHAKQADGRFDDAITDDTKAIQLQPDLAVAYADRGIAKGAKGDLDGAIEDSTKAIELKPDIAVAYYNRARAKKAKGDLDGAIVDCTKAIEFMPQDADSYYYRSHIEQTKGDWVGAITDFTKAIKLKPEYAFLVGDCSQYIKSFPEGKRTEEVREQIDDVAQALQKVQKLARDEGIPLANGFGVNLAGVAIFGGKIDLKTGGSGVLSPYKPGESENLHKYSQGLVKGPLSGYKAPNESPDAQTLEKRFGIASQITPGMTLSQTVAILGNCEAMFEWADRNNYEKLCFYGLKDDKTTILWFDRNDTLEFLHIGATSK
jgi:tetratricopeptide (TPR) repeat protein